MDGVTKNIVHCVQSGSFYVGIKTCDDAVVYYRECGSEEDMTLAETMILHRLGAYREQSNRDRAVLPVDQEVSFFTTVMDECVQFVNPSS